MEVEQYLRFRNTLAPASGFQSAQFRYIEIYRTQLENLVNARGKERLPENPGATDYFEHIYWKDAGMISLGFYRILELELNERLISPLKDLMRWM